MYGHGFMEFPCQRGTLNPNNKYVMMCNDTNAPIDYSKHFPAGEKNSKIGSGDRSIREAAGGKWNPFEPLKKDFMWRAGVCGDLKNGPQDHNKGGRYYYNGKIVADYDEGGVIEIFLRIVGHHNGFMELHLCDIEKCGGEISEDCFKDGHCYQLQRAPNNDCDSGNDLRCGPIDRKYPGRWYFPCPILPFKNNVSHRYGGKKMQYLLPSGVNCEHCVLHWYWAASNDCNPPGMLEYFDGPDAPKWGQCPGPVGSRGGITRSHKECSGDRFPQEYYQCADISVKSSGNSPNVMASDASAAPMETAPETTSIPTEIAPTATPTSEEGPNVSPMIATIATPTPMTEGVAMNGPAMDSQEKSMTTSSGSFKGIAVVADDEVIVESVSDNQQIDVSDYEKVAVEVMKEDNKGPVDFYIDGKKVWREYNGPFFLYGNRGRSPQYAQEPPFNQEFTIEAMGSDGSVKVRMTLEK